MGTRNSRSIEQQELLTNDQENRNVSTVIKRAATRTTEFDVSAFYKPNMIRELYREIGWANPWSLQVDISHKNFSNLNKSQVAILQKQYKHMKEFCNDLELALESRPGDHYLNFYKNKTSYFEQTYILYIYSNNDNCVKMLLVIGTGRIAPDLLSMGVNVGVTAAVSVVVGTGIALAGSPFALIAGGVGVVLAMGGGKIAHDRATLAQSLNTEDKAKILLVTNAIEELCSLNIGSIKDGIFSLNNF